MSDRPVDPIISEYVRNVANRFGAGGLEDLIRLARMELDDARASLKELSSLGEE